MASPGQMLIHTGTLAEVLVGGVRIGQGTSMLGDLRATGIVVAPYDDAGGTASTMRCPLQFDDFTLPVRPRADVSVILGPTYRDVTFRSAVARCWRRESADQNRRWAESFWASLPSPCSLGNDHGRHQFETISRSKTVSSQQNSRHHPDCFRTPKPSVECSNHAGALRPCSPQALQLISYNVPRRRRTGRGQWEGAKADLSGMTGAAHRRSFTQCQRLVDETTPEETGRARLTD